MTRPKAPKSCGTSRNVQLSDRQIAPPGGASHARPAPAAAGRLVFREQHFTHAACGIGALKSALLVDSIAQAVATSCHVLAHVARQTLADLRRIQRLALARQPVAAVAHRLHRRPELPQRPCRLPHSAAAHAELSPPASRPSESVRRPAARTPARSGAGWARRGPCAPPAQPRHHAWLRCLPKSHSRRRAAPCRRACARGCRDGYRGSGPSPRCRSSGAAHCHGAAPWLLQTPQRQ